MRKATRKLAIERSRRSRASSAESGRPAFKAASHDSHGGSSYEIASAVRKIDNFLPSQLRRDIVFQKWSICQARTPRGEASSAAGRGVLRAGNDSLMAPQAMETAQNGLANFRPVESAGWRVDGVDADGSNMATRSHEEAAGARPLDPPPLQIACLVPVSAARIRVRAGSLSRLRAPSAPPRRARVKPLARSSR